MGGGGGRRGQEVREWAGKGWGRYFGILVKGHTCGGVGLGGGGCGEGVRLRIK